MPGRTRIRKRRLRPELNVKKRPGFSKALRAFDLKTRRMFASDSTQMLDTPGSKLRSMRSAAFATKPIWSTCVLWQKKKMVTVFKHLFAIIPMTPARMHHRHVRHSRRHMQESTFAPKSRVCKPVRVPLCGRLIARTFLHHASVATMCCLATRAKKKSMHIIGQS